VDADRVVAGVDEAGRGALAGPVVAAAVILGEDCADLALADSKRLTAAQREQLAAQLRRRAVAWACAEATVEEIERHNILQASLLAMQRAVAALTPAPGEVLVDGCHCPSLPCRVRAIVRGDALVAAISAASILAKVTRDQRMLELHRDYPAYRLDRHKGYATALHLGALRAHGASPIHRRGYRPVRDVLQPGLV